MTKSIHLPIATFIMERSAALKLRRSDLVRRAGFKNVAKGLRRLDELCSGELKTTASLISSLPVALELPPEVIDAAIGQTEQQIVEARQIAKEQVEANWRAKFEPCAYFVGSTDRPSSISMYGLSGGADRWLRIPLDLSQPPVTYAAQALEVVRRTPFVQFFGATTGFVVNYDPDHAIHFDLDGNPVEVLNHAYRPDEVTLTIGGKTIPAEKLFKIAGETPKTSKA